MQSHFSYTIKEEYIDLNGHLTEWGYYAYATRAIWDLNQAYGLLDLYKLHGIGPIIFDTQVNFFKEVFKGERILVEPGILKVSENRKKFLRSIKIYDEQQVLCASFLSNGAFLDLKTRKVIIPKIEVSEAFQRLLII